MDKSSNQNTSTAKNAFAFIINSSNRFFNSISPKHLLLYICILSSIMAWATFLRLYGIGNGLPEIVGLDEGFEVHRALKLGKGQFDFERIAKGGLYFLLAIEYAIYFIILKFLGLVSGTGEFADHFIENLTPFWLIARITVAFIGLATVSLTFYLAKRLYGDMAALIALAIAATAPIFIKMSHVVNVDIPMTFCVIAILILSTQWSFPDGKRRWLLTGFLLGCAIMTKLPAAVLCIPIVTANFLHFRKKSLREAFFSKDLILVFAVALPVLAIGNPGLFFSFKKFFGIFFVLANSPEMSTATLGANETPNLWLFYANGMVSSIGLPLTICSVLAVGYSLYKRKHYDLVMLSFAIPFFVLLCTSKSSHLYYVRYLLPVAAVLAILCANFIQSLPAIIHIPMKHRTLASLIIAILVMIPAISKSAQLSIRQGNEPTSIMVKKWFENNVPEGSKVFLIGNPIDQKALSVPLRNMNENYKKICTDLSKTDQVKGEYCFKKLKTASGVQFNLKTLRHDEINGSFSEYCAEKVEYFILQKIRFAPKYMTGKKYSTTLTEGRVNLYTNIINSPNAKRVIDLPHDSPQRPGFGFEIYHTPSCS